MCRDWMRVGSRYEIQGSAAGVIEVTSDASGVETDLIIRAGAFTASSAGIGVPDLAFSGA